MKLFVLSLALLAPTGPGPTPVATDLVYGSSGQALYRRLRVREVWVEQADFQGGYGGHTTPRHLARYQQLDHAGRVRREERATATGYVLTTAYEYDYDAQGEITDLGEFTRIAWPAGNQPDTSRTGLGWLPFTHTRYPTTARPEGLKVYWQPEAEKWEKLETWTRWQGYDTTYARIVDERSGSATLERSYRAGLRHELQRTDYLHFLGPTLLAANYYYTREAQGRVVESGDLNFGDKPTSGRQPNPAALLAYDALARREAGTPQASCIETYSAQGQLTQRRYPQSDLLITYRRDAKGRLLKTQDNNSHIARTCTYTYLPNGLLASCETVDQLGVRIQSQHYHYRYY